MYLFFAVALAVSGTFMDTPQILALLGIMAMYRLNEISKKEDAE